MYSYPTFTAAENIEIGDVVSYVFKSVTKVILSSISNISYSIPIGVALHSAKCGRAVSVQTEGVVLLNRFAGFEPGRPVFLSHSAGSLSQYPVMEYAEGSIVRYIIGWAVSSNQIRFEPTLLSSAESEGFKRIVPEENPIMRLLSEDDPDLDLPDFWKELKRKVEDGKISEKTTVVAPVTKPKPESIRKVKWI